MWNQLRLTLTHRTRLSETLSRAVAERSLEEIRGRLSPAIHRMSVAEARGYIRARAAHVVCRQTRMMSTEQGGFTTRLEATVRASALERAMHLIVRELLTSSCTQPGWRLAA